MIPGAKSLPFETSEVPGYWGARGVDLSHDACSKDDVDGDGDLCAVGLQLNEDGTGTATTSFGLVTEEIDEGNGPVNQVRSGEPLVSSLTWTLSSEGALQIRFTDSEAVSEITRYRNYSDGSMTALVRSTRGATSQVDTAGL